MLVDKKLTDFTSLFSPYDFKKNDDITLKMNETNKINLLEQTKFWLSEIIGIDNYFHQEINQRKLCSKKSSKYVAAFGHTKNKIKFFDCVKCSAIFNQSHVYRLVIFLNLHHLVWYFLAFHWHSSHFLSSSRIFFLPNNGIKFFMTYFHVNQSLGY